MGSLALMWRRIGTKLYLALGFAVLLTLVSSAVGVYYFERSGDLNYQASSESVPALEASWQATREAERLRSIGMELLAETQSSGRAIEGGAVSESLKRLDNSLGAAGSVPELAADAQTTQEAAYELTGIIDNLIMNRTAALEADLAAKELQDRIDAVSVEDAPSLMALLTLKRASLADDEIALEHEWDAFAELHTRGIDESVAALAEGEGVFAVRSQQLALRAQADDLAGSFSESSAALDNSLTTFLSNAGSQSSSTLGLAVSSFDQGRLLLTIISVVSVVAATLAAWLWVGNGMVRRLSRMSDRMRNMAGGDLETPVPEVGEDEIGELANALEVFRQQALEVQRLNLVEQLYGELREANEELKQMQARLVAQEKLAALGELVSGVAHEISNPLNFVTNFSEGTLELYEELSEMLDRYKSAMSEDDVELLEEISNEISDSLNRVCVNGGRALAIVERMRSMGVEGGELVSVELNSILPRMVDAGLEAFNSQWLDFTMECEFDLDSAVGEVQIAEHDFGEALVNLVANACYAMMLKREERGEEYAPTLRVSSHLVGETVVVRVRDNGTGIADEVAGRIFDPFFSTRDGALGAGLGLPIAADVVRRLGGYMTVDTQYGEYSEFTMTLPTAASADADAD